MSNSNTGTARVQEAGPALYAGVDLALEKNGVVAINQSGQVVARFPFSHDRAGYEYFEECLERVRQREQARTVEVAMEPTNYLWKLLARELEAKGVVYHLVNAYTVKKHREGNQLDRSKDDRRERTIVCGLVGQVFPEFFGVFRKAVELSAGTGYWEYMATVPVPLGTHIFISVEAFDRPGNRATASANPIVGESH